MGLDAGRQLWMETVQNVFDVRAGS